MHLVAEGGGRSTFRQPLAKSWPAFVVAHLSDVVHFALAFSAMIGLRVVFGDVLDDG